MKPTILFIAMLFVSLSAHATGNLVGGHTLLNNSRAPAKSIKRVQYDGYVVGVADDLAGSDLICIPNGTNPRRIINIVSREIRQYGTADELRGYYAPFLIYDILSYYYPC